MSEHMSEPEDELTPLPEATEGSSLSRSPYIALGVAAVVVSTVFATVAALASTQESAAPEPRSQDAIEITTSERSTTDPTTTSAQTSSPAPSSTSSTTTTTTTEDETTTEDDDDTTTPKPPRTTTPKPPTTTTPKPPVNKRPTASFTFSCTDLTCDFDGGGSSDPEGGPLTYSWSCGGSGVTTSCTFPDSGDYEVTLTVTDNKNASDPETKTVTVAAPPTTSGS